MTVCAKSAAKIVLATVWTFAAIRMLSVVGFDPNVEASLQLSADVPWPLWHVLVVERIQRIHVALGGRR
jgi:hypothetical protein